MILMTTSAVHTGTAAATLALCIMFFHHHNSLNVTAREREDIINFVTVANSKISFELKKILLVTKYHMLIRSQVYEPIGYSIF